MKFLIYNIVKTKLLKLFGTKVRKQSSILLILLTILVLFSSVILIITIPPRPVNVLFFGHGIAISDNSGFSLVPKTTTAGDNVYVVWQNNKGHGISNIYFRASKDNGTTFGNIINLSHNTGFSSSPQIAAYNNNVYVVWQSNATRNSEIYFEKIVNVNNNNKSYFTQENLSSNKTASSSLPQIAAYNNNVYVVWQGNNGHGISNIYFSTILITRTSYNDIRLYYGDAVRLDSTLNFSRSPLVTIDKDHVYIVWESKVNRNIITYFQHVREVSMPTIANR